MDVERTIEFILESQAKTEVRLTGITKLLQQGMRMLVKTAEAQKRTEERVGELAGEMKELAGEMKDLARAQKELAKAQKQTERTLQAFIKGQRNGR